MDQPKILLQKRSSNDKENSVKNGPSSKITTNTRPIITHIKPGHTGSNHTESAHSRAGSTSLGKETGAYQKLFPRFHVHHALRFYFNLVEFHPRNSCDELEPFDPKVFPTQNPSTLAIGVIGRSGVGKTSFISQFIDQLIPPEKSAPVLKKPIQGIDLYAADNMIFLDSFPLFHYPERLLKKGFTKECLSLWVKKMVVFLLSACQVVIVMVDKIMDLEVLEYLKTAQTLRKELLRKSKESSSKDEIEQDPHIIIVYNKCKPDHYSLAAFEEAKKIIQNTLEKSQLKLSYSIPSQRLAQALLSEENVPISHVNHYALPYYNTKNAKDFHELESDGKECYWSVPSSYSVAMKELLHHLKLIPNFSVKNRYCFSYREWHQKAAESWKDILQNDLKIG